MLLTIEQKRHLPRDAALARASLSLPRNPRLLSPSNASMSRWQTYQPPIKLKPEHLRQSVLQFIGTLALTLSPLTGLPSSRLQLQKDQTGEWLSYYLQPAPRGQIHAGPSSHWHIPTCNWQIGLAQTNP